MAFPDDLTIVFKVDGDGWIATAPALPGIEASGRTRMEAAAGLVNEFDSRERAQGAPLIDTSVTIETASDWVREAATRLG